MEIEIKIPLSEEEYASLGRKFVASGAEFFAKTDSYYSQYDTKQERLEKGEPLIRLRQEQSETYIGSADDRHKVISEDDILTYKIKSTVNGIENNVERETTVEDMTILKELFEKTGFKCWFTKTKSSLLYNTTVNNIKFNVEVESVNDHKYIEIENIENVDTQGHVLTQDDIVAAIKVICEKFNLDFEKRDGRDWPQILNS